MNTADGVTPASPLPVEGEPAPAEPAAAAARTGEEVEPKKKRGRPESWIHEHCKQRER